MLLHVNVQGISHSNFLHTFLIHSYLWLSVLVSSFLPCFGCQAWCWAQTHLCHERWSTWAVRYEACTLYSTPIRRVHVTHMYIKKINYKFTENSHFRMNVWVLVLTAAVKDSVSCGNSFFCRSSSWVICSRSCDAIASVCSCFKVRCYNEHKVIIKYNLHVHVQRRSCTWTR